ncbi:hypothetical protein BO70DRAFT_360327 [Aspergillus heteromorphus CBS 117.55]|uniref:Uncharacterized protein n=1 Tax=Aspergillus heteromorphus CBS 117.55 TaxID=1448321 RepID=A0A317WMG6_9EURO|nr:uncharacterized protein BO70DRAFT_360327 [Aspergillus heteromorphus CBS 117.55]PWY87686.1 hypothetical protein BO70DRAFT_360327 [Aspergillus heteromorphus CBS 117.55]
MTSSRHAINPGPTNWSLQHNLLQPSADAAVGPHRHPQVTTRGQGSPAVATPTHETNGHVAV